MGGNSAASSNKYALMLVRTLRRMAAVMAFATIMYAISAELGLVFTSNLYTLPLSLIMCRPLWLVFAVSGHILKPLKTEQ
jgi:hypothetical protein